MFSTKNDIMNWLAHDVFKPNHSGLLSSDYDWNGIEIFRILASARDRLGSEFEGIFKGLNNYYIGNNTKKLPRSQASSVTGHKDYQEKLSAVSIAFDPVDIELIASNLIELPFWKFRWQIYEIWIITVSLSEFEKLGFQLSASRDGNSLVELGRQTTLAIHENTPKTFIYQPTYQNRNHAEIRPDIVISSAANATSNNVELIIECKQRVSLDTPHLDSVKDKYESGVCQLTGEVLIVNYDDATPWSRSSQDKTTLIANVRPDSSGDIEFRKLLRSTLIAKSLRKEIWLIDISKSMEILLNDDFRQLLEKRMDSLSPSMMELYGFAQKIEARQPSDIRGEVSMSVSPNDPNWEVLGINRLCDKVREYLKEKNVRLFIVSDLASKINMQLSLGEDERDYVSFIDPITIDSINESII
jgi:hypothetical protein